MENWETDLLKMEDQTQFQAVWERVMEGKPNPIVPGPAPEKPDLSQKPMPLSTAPLCFSDSNCVPLLCQALDRCAQAVADYEKLEKQLPQKLKPKLLPLWQGAEQEFAQLDTAYFLLTAQGYEVKTANTSPLPGDLRLRRRFQQAQLAQSFYQKQAFSAQDPCICTLFLQLELQKKEECPQIQSLLQDIFALRHRRQK